MGATWASDDRIVFGGSKGLMQIPAGGGTATALTKIDASKETSHIRPQFLPGERQVLFTAVMKDGEPAVRRTRSGERHLQDGGPIRHQRPVSLERTSELRAKQRALRRSLRCEDARGHRVGSPGRGKRVAAGPRRHRGLRGVARRLARLFRRGGRAGDDARVGGPRRQITPLAGQAQRQWGTGRLSPDENYPRERHHGTRTAGTSGSSTCTGRRRRA